mmetsp:Transcript_27410/g.77512  ORF Transcript_27410/g.77512 Transcript_27410/m.77512 type:complete len:211 (-) Transcript_27410:625-1257(-)
MATGSTATQQEDEHKCHKHGTHSPSPRRPRKCQQLWAALAHDAGDGGTGRQQLRVVPAHDIGDSGTGSTVVGLCCRAAAVPIVTGLKLWQHCVGFRIQSCWVFTGKRRRPVVGATCRDRQDPLGRHGLVIARQAAGEVAANVDAEHERLPGVGDLRGLSDDVGAGQGLLAGGPAVLAPPVPQHAPLQLVVPQGPLRDEAAPDGRRVVLVE